MVPSLSSQKQLLRVPVHFRSTGPPNRIALRSPSSCAQLSSSGGELLLRIGLPERMQDDVRWLSGHSTRWNSRSPPSPPSGAPGLALCGGARMQLSLLRSLLHLLRTATHA